MLKKAKTFYWKLIVRIYLSSFSGFQTEAPDNASAKTFVFPSVQNLKPLEKALQKFQHFYNSWKNWFSPNLEGVAQKLDMPRPFDVLSPFGRKSKSKAPKALKFCTKRVPIEVNNWWKFGVDISNHFWDIQNWRFFFFQVSPTWKKIVFENYFFSKWGTLGRKN